MRQLLAFGLIAATVLSGCARAPGTSTTSKNGSQAPMAVTSPQSSSTFGANAGTSFANPGPWQTVTVKNEDGTELEALQARGDLGKQGGALTLSTFGSGPKTFNVWAASDAESHGIGLLTTERLVELDAWTGQMYPRLAKSVQVSPDNLEYTVTLRKGLKWSDGKPITSDDVVFTFNTLVKGGFGNSSNRDVLSVYNKFPDVTKVDPLTIKFRTAKQFAPFLHSLGSISIAPKHVLEPITKKPVGQFNTFWDVNMDPAQMVGCGPFLLKRYVPGQRVELKRNPDYFMVDKNGTRLPYLDTFTVAVVPDQNTQVLKFYGGEIDMLDVRSVKGSDVALMKQRQGQGNFTMYNLGPDDGTVFLMFNMAQRLNPKTKKPYVDPIKQKWFNDVRFRQAVSHALNRQRYIDNVLRGVGIPLYTPESPASTFFNQSLQPYPQDLDLAANLLKEAGFVKEDNALYDSAGHRVEFNLLTNAGNTQRDGVSVGIVEDLKKLGMKVNYQPIDFNILIDKLETSLQWEACVMGLTGNKTEPYDGANVWKVDGRLHMFDQRLPDKDGTVVVTDARDWEKRIDTLFNEGATVLDVKKRKAIYDEYQKIVYEQVPFIYLYSQLAVTAARNTIGNYKPTPLGVFYTPKGSLHNIEEIFMRTR